MNYTLSEIGPATPELDSPTIAWVDVFNPVRQDIEMSDWQYQGQGWFAGHDNEPFSASMPYPARYTNRDAYEKRDFELDGFYYLRVGADSDKDRSTTTFLLTVQVAGDPEPGPDYRPGRTVTSSTTATVSSGSPNSTSAGTSARSTTTDTTATGTTPTDTAETGTAVAGTGSDSARWVVVGGLIAVVAAAGVGLAVWWSRRRRTG